MKLSDYVFEFVADQGVRQIFMVAGGGAMHLNNSLGKSPRLEYICNLHEQAAAIAAEGAAKLTKKLGVALVTTGPGGTNTVTGVAGAWLDSSPVMFISGQVKRADLHTTVGTRMLGFQEVDIVSVVKPITKYAVMVTEPSEIRYHLEKAAYLAQHGRPGPVWLDIPMDVQAAQVEPDLMKGFSPDELPSTHSDDLEKKVAAAIDLLNAAERPILWGGNGIHLAGAETEFRELVERTQIPVLLAWLGMDLLPQDHPLFVGRPGSVAPRGANFALQNSDWLMSVGARLDMSSTGYAHENLARAARKIMVDVDPAEIHKMRMNIDVPAPVDAGDFIREFLRQSGRIIPRDRSAWLARCQQWKEKYPVVLPEYRQLEDRVSTYVFSDTLSKILKENQIVVTASSGAGIEIFLLSYKVKNSQRLIHTGGLGAMGFGLPAAVGVCLASGRQPTICVEADGGIQLNAQELETIHRLNLPLKIFVLNNQGYASIRISQQRYFNLLVGADATSGLSLPDMCRVAEAYGIPSLRINSQHNLEGQIKHVIEQPGPVLCDVSIVPDEPRVPSLSTVQMPDGRMVSRPMEDLAPFLDRDELRANMIVPLLED
ncbi:MAG TPA: thiamine pyrophosphate-binding protein [Anaerolineaceae bacterium]|nr:thiamine pyrophosphate-binding protein [Anaerolineaceae bacterium]HPN51443.1 thiamine pyrophosphate-binding protein [Anaerolineaceae bacterium]